MERATGTAAVQAARLKASFTPSAFRQWAAASQPGARIIYAIGENAHHAAGPLVATTILAFSGGGYVHLFQARRPAEDRARGLAFDYIAVRSRKPWPAELEPPLLRELAAIGAAA